VNPTRKQAIEELGHMVLETLGKHDAEIWLAGSFARGDTRQHSDIDIAILPRGDLPSSLFAELSADFEESTIPMMPISLTFGPQMARWSKKCVIKV
jgi:uncharacterized protein